MKNFSLLILCCFSITFARAQYYRLAWAKSAGGTNSDVTSSLAVDASGNVYTCGAFKGTVDFDPGPGVVNLTSAGAEDIFVAKYDSSGNFKWAVPIGGTASDYCWTITIGSTGNILTSGVFRNIVDFNPGSGTENLSSVGGNDMFVLSLDATGNFDWVKQISGVYEQRPSSITTDATGNIYTTGSFSGSSDFNPGSGTYIMNTSTATGPNNAFVLKLDPYGNFVWAKQFTGTLVKSGGCIKVDAGQNVYTVGSLSGTGDFDPGSGLYELKSAGSSDIYVSKLDGAGNFLWARQIGGKVSDRASSCALDAKGNVYVTGAFADTVDFDPGLGVVKISSVLTSLESTFVLKLDTAGLFKWVKQFHGSNGTCIALDPSGNIYTTGSFRVDSDFDPGTATYYLHVKSGAVPDVFLSKLDTAGNFVWAQSIGSIGYDDGEALTADGAGHIYAVGSFNDTVDFDPSVSTFYMNAKGTDGFVLKLDECKAYSSFFSKTTCEPYIFNSKVFTASGTYTEIFSTVKGCDSTVTFDLDVVKVNPVITAYGLTMGIGTIVGAAYQWIKCPSYTPIPGATGRTYTAPVKGNYAVIVTLGDCIDTSDCYNAIPLSLANEELAQATIILPNPTPGELRVLNPAFGNARMDIIDVLGNLKLSCDRLDGDDTFDLSAFPPGVYFIRILDGQHQQSIQRVIKY